MESKKINIPIWLVILIIPLLVTILLTSFASLKVQANNNGSVETSLTEINKRLDRIEDKVEKNTDNLIKIFNNGK